MVYLGVRVLELANFENFVEARIRIKDDLYINLQHEYIFDSREKRTISFKLETRVLHGAPIVKKLLLIPFQTLYPLIYGTRFGIKLWLAPDPDSLVEGDLIDAGEAFFFESVDRARKNPDLPRVLIQVLEVHDLADADQLDASSPKGRSQGAGSVNDGVSTGNNPNSPTSKNVSNGANRNPSKHIAFEDGENASDRVNANDANDKALKSSTIPTEFSPDVSPSRRIPDCRMVTPSVVQLSPNELRKREGGNYKVISDPQFVEDALYGQRQPASPVVHTGARVRTPATVIMHYDEEYTQGYDETESEDEKNGVTYDKIVRDMRINKLPTVDRISNTNNNGSNFTPGLFGITPPVRLDRANDTGTTPSPPNRRIVSQNRYGKSESKDSSLRTHGNVVAPPAGIVIASAKKVSGDGKPTSNITKIDEERGARGGSASPRNVNAAEVESAVEHPVPPKDSNQMVTGSTSNSTGSSVAQAPRGSLFKLSGLTMPALVTTPMMTNLSNIQQRASLIAVSKPVSGEARTSSASRESNMNRNSRSPLPPPGPQRKSGGPQTGSNAQGGQATRNRRSQLSSQQQSQLVSQQQSQFPSRQRSQLQSQQQSQLQNPQSQQAQQQQPQSGAQQGVEQSENVNLKRILTGSKSAGKQNSANQSGLASGTSSGSTSGVAAARKRVSDRKKSEFESQNFSPQKLATAKRHSRNNNSLNNNNNGTRNLKTRVSGLGTGSIGLAPTVGDRPAATGVTTTDPELVEPSKEEGTSKDTFTGASQPGIRASQRMGSQDRNGFEVANVSLSRTGSQQMGSQKRGSVSPGTVEQNRASEQQQSGGSLENLKSGDSMQSIPAVPMPGPLISQIPQEQFQSQPLSNNQNDPNQLHYQSQSDDITMNLQVQLSNGNSSRHPRSASETRTSAPLAGTHSSVYAPQLASVMSGMQHMPNGMQSGNLAGNIANMKNPIPGTIRDSIAMSPIGGARPVQDVATVEKYPPIDTLNRRASGSPGSKSLENSPNDNSVSDHLVPPGVSDMRKRRRFLRKVQKWGSQEDSNNNGHSQHRGATPHGHVAHGRHLHTLQDQFNPVPRNPNEVAHGVQGAEIMLGADGKPYLVGAVAPHTWGGVTMNTGGSIANLGPLEPYRNNTETVQLPNGGPAVPRLSYHPATNKIVRLCSKTGQMVVHTGIDAEGHVIVEGDVTGYDHRGHGLDHERMLGLVHQEAETYEHEHPHQHGVRLPHNSRERVAQNAREMTSNMPFPTPRAIMSMASEMDNGHRGSAAMDHHPGSVAMDDGPDMVSGDEHMMTGQDKMRDRVMETGSPSGKKSRGFKKKKKTHQSDESESHAYHADEANTDSKQTAFEGKGQQQRQTAFQEDYHEKKRFDQLLESRADILSKSAMYNHESDEFVQNSSSANSDPIKVRQTVTNVTIKAVQNASRSASPGARNQMAAANGGELANGQERGGSRASNQDEEATELERRDRAFRKTKMRTHDKVESGHQGPTHDDLDSVIAQDGFEETPNRFHYKYYHRKNHDEQHEHYTLDNHTKAGKFVGHAQAHTHAAYHKANNGGAHRGRRERRVQQTQRYLEAVGLLKKGQSPGVDMPMPKLQSDESGDDMHIHPLRVSGGRHHSQRGGRGDGSGSQHRAVSLPSSHYRELASGVLADEEPITSYDAQVHLTTEPQSQEARINSLKANQINSDIARAAEQRKERRMRRRPLSGQEPKSSSGANQYRVDTPDGQSVTTSHGDHHAGHVGLQADAYPKSSYQISTTSHYATASQYVPIDVPTHLQNVTLDRSSLSPEQLQIIEHVKTEVRHRESTKHLNEEELHEHLRLVLVAAESLKYTNDPASLIPKLRGSSQFRDYSEDYVANPNSPCNYDYFRHAYGKPTDNYNRYTTNYTNMFQTYHPSAYSTPNDEQKATTSKKKRSKDERSNERSKELSKESSSTYGSRDRAPSKDRTPSKDRSASKDRTPSKDRSASKDRNPSKDRDPSKDRLASKERTPSKYRSASKDRSKSEERDRSTSSSRVDDEKTPSRHRSGSRNTHRSDKGSKTLSSSKRRNAATAEETEETLVGSSGDGDMLSPGDDIFSVMQREMRMIRNIGAASGPVSDHLVEKLQEWEHLLTSLKQDYKTTSTTIEQQVEREVLRRTETIRRNYEMKSQESDAHLETIQRIYRHKLLVAKNRLFSSLQSGVGASGYSPSDDNCRSVRSNQHPLIRILVRSLVYGANILKTSARDRKIAEKRVVEVVRKQMGIQNQNTLGNRQGISQPVLENCQNVDSSMSGLIKPFSLALQNQLGDTTTTGCTKKGNHAMEVGSPSSNYGYQFAQEYGYLGIDESKIPDIGAEMSPSQLKQRLGLSFETGGGNIQNGNVVNTLTFGNIGNSVNTITAAPLRLGKKDATDAFVHLGVDFNENNVREGDYLTEQQQDFVTAVIDTAISCHRYTLLQHCFSCWAYLTSLSQGEILHGKGAAGPVGPIGLMLNRHHTDWDTIFSCWVRYSNGLNLLNALFANWRVLTLDSRRRRENERKAEEISRKEQEILKRKNSYEKVAVEKLNLDKALTAALIKQEEMERENASLEEAISKQAAKQAADLEKHMREAREQEEAEEKKKQQKKERKSLRVRKAGFFSQQKGEDSSLNTGFFAGDDRGTSKGTTTSSGGGGDFTGGLLGGLPSVAVDAGSRRNSSNPQDLVAMLKESQLRGNAMRKTIIQNSTDAAPLVEILGALDPADGNNLPNVDEGKRLSGVLDDPRMSHGVGEIERPEILTDKTSSPTSQDGPGDGASNGQAGVGKRISVQRRNSIESMLQVSEERLVVLLNVANTVLEEGAERERAKEDKKARRKRGHSIMAQPSQQRPTFMRAASAKDLGRVQIEESETSFPSPGGSGGVKSLGKIVEEESGASRALRNKGSSFGGILIPAPKLDDMRKASSDFSDAGQVNVNLRAGPQQGRDTPNGSKDRGGDKSYDRQGSLHSEVWVDGQSDADGGDADGDVNTSGQEAFMKLLMMEQERAERESGQKTGSNEQKPKDSPNMQDPKGKRADSTSGVLKMNKLNLREDEIRYVLTLVNHTRQQQEESPMKHFKEGEREHYKVEITRYGKVDIYIIESFVERTSQDENIVEIEYKILKENDPACCATFTDKYPLVIRGTGLDHLVQLAESDSPISKRGATYVFVKNHMYIEITKIVRRDSKGNDVLPKQTEVTASGKDKDEEVISKFLTFPEGDIQAHKEEYIAAAKKAAVAKQEKVLQHMMELVSSQEEGLRGMDIEPQSGMPETLRDRIITRTVDRWGTGGNGIMGGTKTSKTSGKVTPRSHTSSVTLKDEMDPTGSGKLKPHYKYGQDVQPMFVGHSNSHEDLDQVDVGRKDGNVQNSGENSGEADKGTIQPKAASAFVVNEGTISEIEKQMTEQMRQDTIGTIGDELDPDFNQLAPAECIGSGDLDDLMEQLIPDPDQAEMNAIEAKRNAKTRSEILREIQAAGQNKTESIFATGDVPISEPTSKAPKSGIHSGIAGQGTQFPSRNRNSMDSEESIDYGRIAVDNRVEVKTILGDKITSSQMESVAEEMKSVKTWMTMQKAQHTSAGLESHESPGSAPSSSGLTAAVTATGQKIGESEKEKELKITARAGEFGLGATDSDSLKPQSIDGKKKSEDVRHYPMSTATNATIKTVAFNSNLSSNPSLNSVGAIYAAGATGVAVNDDSAPGADSSQDVAQNPNLCATVAPTTPHIPNIPSKDSRDPKSVATGSDTPASNAGSMCPEAGNSSMRLPSGGANSSMRPDSASIRGPNSLTQSKKFGSERAEYGVGESMAEQTRPQSVSMGSNTSNPQSASSRAQKTIAPGDSRAPKARGQDQLLEDLAASTGKVSVEQRSSSETGASITVSPPTKSGSLAFAGKISPAAKRKSVGATALLTNIGASIAGDFTKVQGSNPRVDREKKASHEKENAQQVTEAASSVGTTTKQVQKQTIGKLQSNLAKVKQSLNRVEAEKNALAHADIVLENAAHPHPHIPDVEAPHVPNIRQFDLLEPGATNLETGSPETAVNPDEESANASTKTSKYHAIDAEMRVLPPGELENPKEMVDSAIESFFVEEEGQEIADPVWSSENDEIAGGANPDDVLELLTAYDHGPDAIVTGGGTSIDGEILSQEEETSGTNGTLQGRGTVLEHEPCSPSGMKLTPLGAHWRPARQTKKIGAAAVSNGVGPTSNGSEAALLCPPNMDSTVIHNTTHGVDVDFTQMKNQYEQEHEHQQEHDENVTDPHVVDHYGHDVESEHVHAVENLDGDLEHMFSTNDSFLQKDPHLSQVENLAEIQKQLGVKLHSSGPGSGQRKSEISSSTGGRKSVTIGGTSSRGIPGNSKERASRKSTGGSSTVPDNLSPNSVVAGEKKNPTTSYPIGGASPGVQRSSIASDAPGGRKYAGGSRTSMTESAPMTRMEDGRKSNHELSSYEVIRNSKSNEGINGRKRDPKKVLTLTSGANAGKTPSASLGLGLSNPQKQNEIDAETKNRNKIE